MKKFFRWFLKHKIVLGLIIIVLGGGGYLGYKKFFVKTQSVRYVTSAAEKGLLITSISGTGQISVSNQVNVNPKASGDITSINVTVGQEIKSGTVIATINAKEALKTVRDAETSLESAKISYAKLVQPADELSLLQAENSLAAAKENREQTEETLNKNYEDGFNSVTNAFLDLPTVMAGLKDILYGYDYSNNYTNIDWYANQGVSLNSNNNDIYNKISLYRQNVNDAYAAARKKYDANFDLYKTVSRDVETATIDSLIMETYETTKLVSDAVKSANNFVDLIQDLMLDRSSDVTIPSLMSTHQNSLDNYTSKTNSHLTNLLSAKNTIANSKSSLVTADRSIAEKTASLEELKAGADSLDIQSQKLSLKQKENSLLDAKEKLADYTIRAPFDGVVAEVDIKKGDTVSSGSTAVILVTKQKIATISLNESDIAKVAVGQKVNLTFDALEDLTITGEVAEVDSLGTTSQGVVSYNVKIAFDVQDDRVKSGMSINAEIITSSKADVLMVSSSAVKTFGSSNYVEILIDGVPQKKTVTIGDSNDTMTEIISGLAEGEEIITQTIKISSSSSNKTSTTKSTTNIMGGMMIGGGAGGPPPGQ
ncbi:MAG TPA: efflux RND transporter periplasmic adaptor subunit [Candidatus Magasanikbacteria bacterium]|nr:efflux RND transporter periplasmic adaptor subunit [Candidatus Magasanikbacteria bacterium]